MSVTAGLRLVDQHCHGVLARDLSPGEFASRLTEAADAGGRDPWHSLIGLAVRRWCAPLLGLEPLSSAHDYLARRAQLGWREVTGRLLTDAGVTDWLVDTGYGGPGELGPGTTHEVLRVEQVAEELAAEASTGLLDAIRERLRRRAAGAVALKTIVAYRSGLDLPPDPPSRTGVRAAVDDWLRSGDPRLRNPVVHSWLVHEAARVGTEMSLPLQFHTGFGDPDLHLRTADPLLLTRFIRATTCQVVLLHCWPFHRNAAYLAHAYPHVSVDIGLTLPFVGARGEGVLGETLEVAPFDAILYSSDGCDLPELHHLGAVLFRHHLGALLDGWLADGTLTTADAERIARDIGADNARRLHKGLSRPATGRDRT